ncbi:MAG TPA: putative quinol monooxygenase [Geodermatophilus sp.]|nr:putative quinol monooxygenase [Geodermatophilus sp.]
MFSLMVQVQVRPERREEFLAAIAENAQVSVRDEPGCLRFDVCSVEADPNRFLFYELYVDAAAFEAHRAAAHFTAWREAAERTLVPGSQVNTRGALLHSHTSEESA